MDLNDVPHFSGSSMNVLRHCCSLYGSLLSLFLSLELLSTELLNARSIVSRVHIYTYARKSAENNGGGNGS